ncbi:hypothetical protein ACFXPA_38130 [Amycolatopsis sp. NPDC059090]|uniref:hypothetical protein n=1 Tax=Amycolatopsis sp. NPDC059090 TaxID=3346723 RepID=UPI003673142B
MRQGRHRVDRRRFKPGLVVAAVLLLPVTAGAAGAVSAQPPTARSTDLGSNVTIFDPSMPVTYIQAKVDGAYAQQVDSEMGSQRYAFLFKPGSYGTPTQPLQLKVGYYTDIAGLGASPTDVVINGKVEAYNRCLDPGGTTGCVALVNFWRSVSNLTIDVNAAGQDGCRASANFWAVSQAAAMRRVNILGGTLSLMDYCTAGPQYASGGFVADSRLPSTVNGSQQQWLVRDSEVAGWSNGVWNQVFSGVVGAPAESGFPNPPYTTLDTTSVEREKPYLVVDAAGRYGVRVPAAQRSSRGITWADGPGPGRTVPIDDFYVAKPSDSAWVINQQLARGKNLLLTPGVYNVSRSIEVNRPGTVVLGLGQATLTAVRGAVPLTTSGAPGVIIAGVTIDAGDQLSPALLRVGSAHGAHRGSPADPTTLSDVYFRVGGPHVGKVNTALEVDADNVLIDNAWVWRADHGVEGLTDSERWTANTGRYGVVVNGDHVTAHGLFVEHFQRYNVLWNGEDGTTVFFQNELPYDPPTQADWTNGTEQGWPGYKVADDVRSHALYGGGVYVFNRNNPSIHSANGFETPRAPGVRMHHIMTVNLGAGTIDHVVNGVGGPAETTSVGAPVDIVDYPTH